VKKDQPTGDSLLDESLQHMKENEAATVKEWIEYLSGESWNPLKLRLQLRQVRQRLAKNLTEKGVCTTEKQNFVVFDMTTHPLVDSETKQRLLRRVQDGLLSRYCNDARRYDKRLLSLLYLAQASDVLENALNPLNDDDFDLAMKRVRDLSELDCDAESAKDGACEVMWAVFSSFDS
jgi:Golgi phosphoprotein 3